MHCVILGLAIPLGLMTPVTVTCINETCNGKLLYDDGDRYQDQVQFFKAKNMFYMFQMSFIALSSHPHPSPLVLTATSRTAVIAVLHSVSMAEQLSILIVTPWKAMPADMIPYRWQVTLYIMIIDQSSQRSNI